MAQTLKLEPVAPGRRRRYTPEQKRSLLDEAARPGASISEFARTYGIAPSVVFLRKRTMDDAMKEGLKGNERVVAESEVKKLEARIRSSNALLVARPWGTRSCKRP